jgi:hypothetical protein
MENKPEASKIIPREAFGLATGVQSNISQAVALLLITPWRNLLHTSARFDCVPPLDPGSSDAGDLVSMPGLVLCGHFRFESKIHSRCLVAVFRVFWHEDAKC